MRFIDEYRDTDTAMALSRAIHESAARAARPWTIMEVCGGQTHSIVKFGVEALLPKAVRLVHGPGCPVCVTPAEIIDKAIEIALHPNVILVSFGDMIRVPGSRTGLLSAKAGGADVRIVYSPLDAVKIAQVNPSREVVFFAVGFETTAPANAMAVYTANTQGLKNFSLLVSHVLVPPAMEAILESPDNQVEGFLAAGHVCTIMGYTQYEPLAKKYRVPIVVTGFEPVDILQGVLLCVTQLEEGRYDVENQYSRSVSRRGNKRAQSFIDEIFEVVPRRWRGIGDIPQSGLCLRKPYAHFDAEERFGKIQYQLGTAQPDSECISGWVLRGIKKPEECSAFGQTCTPEHPLGAPMVSGEGACAAYYRYRHIEKTTEAAHGV